MTLLKYISYSHESVTFPVRYKFPKNTGKPNRPSEMAHWGYVRRLIWQSIQKNRNSGFMLYAAKKLVQGLTRKMGYDIRKVQRYAMGTNPYTDMSIYLEQEKRPVIFDVGANHGQSLEKFKALFPSSRVHSFEPGE
jgi:hypothetical protein